MAKFHYVYLLVNESRPTCHYVGITRNLADRLNAHNAGQVPHTAKYRPWHIDVVVAFRDRARAASFERYLKSHSGRAFASKHL